MIFKKIGEVRQEESSGACVFEKQAQMQGAGLPRTEDTYAPPLDDELTE